MKLKNRGLYFGVVCICFQMCGTIALPKAEEPQWHHNYIYQEVDEFKLLFENMFFVNQEDYYTYFYSVTCGYCNSLKQDIIPYAVKNRNIYFIEISEAIPMTDVYSDLVGCERYEEITLFGYPSLLQITDKKVTKYCVGVSQIKSSLKI